VEKRSVWSRSRICRESSRYWFYSNWSIIEVDKDKMEFFKFSSIHVVRVARIVS